MNTENTETNTTPNEDAPTFTGSATYCPEDNKLRLYVGRVPRDEYLKLRADGWISTPKQSCDFVATWTPSRRDTAIDYAGVIEDEDMSPEERAADRAERFGGYRDKRTSEATDRADTYDAGPQAHGFQSQARAERSARRHDRIAGRACDAWDKAEYWTHRTAGVISHALYKCRPDVRMGRIKTLEAEQRKLLGQLEECAKRFNTWKKISEITDPEAQTAAAIQFANGNGCNLYDYQHPRPETVTNAHVKENGSSLYTLLTHADYCEPITGAEACALFLARHIDPASPDWERTAACDWQRHYILRIGYENQMLEAQGGRAAFVEMVAGGWIAGRQIRKVNKSSVTGRVVSVEVMGTRRGFTKESGHKIEETRPCPVLINIERLPADSYEAPNLEDLATLAATLKAEKAARPAVITPPLINPTDADAERLQAIWNEERRALIESRKWSCGYVPQTVCRIKQETYSRASSGSYGNAEIRALRSEGYEDGRESNMYDADRIKKEAAHGPRLCKIRRTYGESNQAPRVIVITDKPQKPLPAAVWAKYIPTPAAPVEQAAFAL